MTLLFKYSSTSSPSTKLSCISYFSQRLISLKYSISRLGFIWPTFMPQTSFTTWNLRGRSHSTSLYDPFRAVVELVMVRYMRSPSQLLNTYLLLRLLKVYSTPIQLSYFSFQSISLFSALLRSSLSISISLACPEFILITLSSSFSTDFSFFSIQQRYPFSSASLAAYSLFIFSFKMRLFSRSILSDQISMLLSFSANCEILVARILFSCSILVLSFQFSSALQYSSYFFLMTSLEYLFLLSRVQIFSMEVSMYQINFILSQKRPDCLTCWWMKSIFQCRNYTFYGSCTGLSWFISQ